jgi:murein DD-endopeptidase MepM/ murein hydrolase activator NlpD
LALDRTTQKVKAIRTMVALGVALAASAMSVLAQESSGLNLALPTDNDALFHGGGAEFYQYITRDFQGVKSTPWEGGQYGFVRNPVETSAGLVYTRFHEGIDIRPMQRDARGEPLDAVRAIANGTVVHANLVPRYSNYGRYVVVEHRWDGSSYFSLYGHLASVAVKAGTKVNRGAQLGIMGYSGDGLDQARAHVHLELNLLYSRRFESWYDNFIKNDPNHHGIYSGINLAGLDVARLYLALEKNPALTIPEFLAGEETFYKVTLPATPTFDLAQRYPWLLRSSDSKPASWEVSFNGAGVPLKVEPTTRAVISPTLSYVKKDGGDYSNQTRGLVVGSGENAHLSESGLRQMRLLIWPD